MQVRDHATGESAQCETVPAVAEAVVDVAVSAADAEEEQAEAGKHEDTREQHKVFLFFAAHQVSISLTRTPPTLAASVANSCAFFPNTI